MPLDDDVAALSWERELRLDKAHEQEPRPRARAPVHLDPNGTVRTLFEAPLPTSGDDLNRAVVYYTLDADRNPVPCDDVIAWAQWSGTAERLVARDEPMLGVIVSTVFLGIDQGSSSDGLPLLWETLIAGGELDGQRDRYDSHGAAVRGHGHWLEAVTLGERSGT